MKQRLLWTCLAVIALAGCTTFNATQKDIRNGEENEITTTIKGTAFFTSAQSISAIKAQQTEKTQTFNLDDLKQHGATNVVSALNAIAEIIKAIQPTP